MNTDPSLIKDPSAVELWANRQSKRERLKIEQDVLLLRCCMMTDENGIKPTRAEALRDYVFIKDSLVLYEAEALLNGFGKRKKLGKKSAYKKALEDLLQQDIIAYSEPTEEQKELTRAAYPPKPNNWLIKRQNRKK